MKYETEIKKFCLKINRKCFNLLVKIYIISWKINFENDCDPTVSYH